MNELQIEALKALRSGEYQQAVGRLRVGDTYCANGVLCNVHNPEAWVWDANECRWYFLTDHGVTMSMILPSELRAIFDLDWGTNNYFLDRNNFLVGFTDVIYFNDDARLTLPQIADVLEYYWSNRDKTD